MDRQTGKTKLIVCFSNFVNMSKNITEKFFVLKTGTKNQYTENLSMN
jgi:hypothetical protein